MVFWLPQKGGGAGAGPGGAVIGMPMRCQAEGSVAKCLYTFLVPANLAPFVHVCVSGEQPAEAG